MAITNSEGGASDSADFLFFCQVWNINYGVDFERLWELSYGKIISVLCTEKFGILSILHDVLNLIFILYLDL